MKMKNNLIDYNKILLCIDAGFVGTGISAFGVTKDELVFLDCKTIKTVRNTKKTRIRVADDDAERIIVIVQGILDFAKQFDNKDIMVGIELPTGGAQGARANRAMGMITGSIVTLVEIMNWPVEYITPNDVKIAVTGSRKASKDEIMYIIREKLTKQNPSVNLPKSKSVFEHIADSVGVCWFLDKHSTTLKIFRK